MVSFVPTVKRYIPDTVDFIVNYYHCSSHKKNPSCRI
nr:MAG TPA: hypothetical protein [Caudoviricetes sp.]